MNAVGAASLEVRDLMTSKVFAVRADDDLSTVRELMVERDVRHVPVVDDEGNLVGLVSQRDLLRNSLIEQPGVPDYIEDAVLERVVVGEVMTSFVDRVTAELDLREAAQLMFENKYGCLPVTEGDRLVGILTESDFVRFMARGD